MKAYETAPNAAQQQNFYPLPATGLEEGEEFGVDNSAAIVAAGRRGRQQYLDMPRNLKPEPAADFGDKEDDQQIREMENLLAEIGQDVSELKVSDSIIFN